MAIKLSALSNKTKKPPQQAGLPESQASETVGKPRLLVDRLMVTVRLPEPENAKLLAAVQEAFTKGQGPGSISSNSKYEFVKSISLLNGGRVHIQAVPKKSYFPALCLECNPSVLGPVGMKKLKNEVKGIWPDGWDLLLEHGRVSRVDAAADFYGLRMRHFYLLPNTTLAVKTWENGGKLKTIAIGKPSGQQLVVYSKSYQLKVKFKDKAPGGPAIVRFERRIKPPDLALSELGSLPNPFINFSVVTDISSPPPAASKNVKWCWDFFVDAVYLRGLTECLNKVPKNQRPIFRKHFQAHQAVWWDPPSLWSAWPKALEEAGIF